MINVEHSFLLYPDVTWIANSVLKRLQLPTEREQGAIRRRLEDSMTERLLILDMGNARNFGEMASAYEEPNAIQDLKILENGPEKINVREIISQIKREYNEAITQIQGNFPEYLKLTWEIFRRIGHQKDIHSLSKRRLEGLLHPEEPTFSDKLRISEEFQSMLKLEANTDEGKINYALSTSLERRKIKKALNTKPDYRLVEFDSTYFYETGRFAFANKEGDIFQTIWNVRKEQVPLFT